VEGLARLQDDQVLAALGVGQLDLIARAERAAALSDHARQVSGGQRDQGGRASSALVGVAVPRR
jgi:hypothetical protein